MLHVFVHLETMSKTSFTVYEYLNIPIIGISSNVNGTEYQMTTTANQFKLENRYIALPSYVKRPEKPGPIQAVEFLEMDSLNTCQGEKPHVICRRDVLFANNNSSCLSALFFHDTTSINQVCSPVSYTKPFFVKQIGRRSFFFYSAIRSSGKIICGKQRQKHSLAIGTSIINIPQNCTFIGGQVVLTPTTIVKTAEIIPLVIDPSFANQLTIMDPDLHPIHNVTTIALEEIPFKDLQPIIGHPFALPMAMTIGGILVIALLICMLYCYCKSKPSSPSTVVNIAQPEHAPATSRPLPSPPRRSDKMPEHYTDLEMVPMIRPRHVEREESPPRRPPASDYYNARKSDSTEITYVRSSSPSPSDPGPPTKGGDVTID